MAYATRSKTKSHEGNTSMKGTASTSPVSEAPSLRRSTRLTSAKQTNSGTPPSTRNENFGTRKSARLEQKSTQTPSRKRKSENEEMSNPSRQSKRVKDGPFLTSDSDKTLASHFANKEKEKSIVQLTDEAKQVTVTREHNGAARVRRSFTDARCFKAMFLKKPGNMDVEGCQNSTSSERKRKAVEIDAGISAKIVNEDTCNTIAVQIPSLDEHKMMHSVETRETCLKRKRVDCVSTGQETYLSGTKELVENYCSNDDREGSFQVSDSSLNPTREKHPSSSSPSTKGRLDCAESGEVHGKLSLGVAETPHLGVTSDNMFCVYPQPGEESMPCDGTSLTGVNALRVFGIANPEDGMCDVGTEAPSYHVQSAAKVYLSLPNAEVAVGSDGLVDGSGGCMDGTRTVNWTSSSEQITDGAIPDKEETSTRNEMLGSKNALENFAPLHLASSELDNEGDTVSLSEARIPGGTSHTVSGELMGFTNIRVDADMNVTFLDNVAAAGLQGERCRATDLNPHSVKHTMLDSLSRLPLGKLMENPEVSLNEALQGEDTPCSLVTLRDADPTVSERQSQFAHLACPVNDAEPSDRSNYQHTVEQIGTLSFLNPPLQQAEISSSANSLPSMLGHLSILSARGVQHQPGSSENVSNSIIHSTVKAVDNAAEISNLVSAELATKLEPGPLVGSLVDASVRGLGAPLSEAKSTSNSSTNNGHSESGMQVSSRIPPPSFDDSLQNEVERIRKEIDEAKNHEDMKLWLKSECEKAIEEEVAQIQWKYDVKLKELEREYLQKRNALDASHNAVTMHIILAEAFRSKCLDREAPCMGMQQDASRTQQQMFQRPTEQKAQRSTLVAGPTSSGPSSVSLQNMTSTSNLLVVPTLRPAQVFSSLTARPQFNSGPVATPNIQSSCEMRAPAPHLQPFKPSASSRTSQSLCQPLRASQVSKRLNN